MYKEGYYGIVRIPYEYLGDILAGRATINLPKGVEIQHTVSNHVCAALDVVLYSKKEVKGVTFKVNVGAEIPLSNLTLTMHRPRPGCKSYIAFIDLGDPYKAEIKIKDYHDNKCGVCNYEIPRDHAQLIMREENGTFTYYHMECGHKAEEIKPCEDCGYHRLLCDDCAELDNS